MHLSLFLSKLMTALTVQLEHISGRFIKYFPSQNTISSLFCCGLLAFSPSLPRVAECNFREE